MLLEELEKELQKNLLKSLQNHWNQTLICNLPKPDVIWKVYYTG